MENPTQIILPHGGYKNLIAYKKSETIYQGTVIFCRRFLNAYKDRTVDQMTQAARSCKQNIAEGSAASGTSKETELKLTNVARASLDELLGDYIDQLKSHNLAEWDYNDDKKIVGRQYAENHPDWGQHWMDIFTTRPPETICNLIMIIIYQTRYLLDKMIKTQENDFLKHGGVRERMYNARKISRGLTFENELFNRLSQAQTPAELLALSQRLIAAINKTQYRIRQDRHWM